MVTPQTTVNQVPYHVGVIIVTHRCKNHHCRISVDSQRIEEVEPWINVDTGKTEYKILGLQRFPIPVISTHPSNFPNPPPSWEQSGK